MEISVFHTTVNAVEFACNNFGYDGSSPIITFFLVSRPAEFLTFTCI